MEAEREAGGDRGNGTAQGSRGGGRKGHECVGDSVRRDTGDGTVRNASGQAVPLQAGEAADRTGQGTHGNSDQVQAALEILRMVPAAM